MSTVCQHAGRGSRNFAPDLAVLSFVPAIQIPAIVMITIANSEAGS
jgi:hypothetical protein